MGNSSTVEPVIAIGLMSGTSADGIDAAVVRITGSGLSISVELLGFFLYSYSPSVREAIFRLFDPETSRVDHISAMNFLLGEIFAEAALVAITSAGLTPSQVDLIASHGQTIWHEPNGIELAGRLVRSTFQIGEPSVIAERTGITTVADFRTADVAAGGQGAPLVAYADYVLFRDAHVTLAVQNIGGIANVTYLPARCGIDDVIAFDTGPGNMLLDAASRRFTGRQFDADGETAAKGLVDQALLERLMDNPFFAAPPPKSTGREMFGEQFLNVLLDGPASGMSTEDLLATLTAFTARSIADQYRRWLPKMPEEVILGGGGAHNQTLRRMLQAELSPTLLSTHEEFGIPTDAKEAVAFAILGVESASGVPANAPSATGARHPVVLGKICPGRKTQ